MDQDTIIQRSGWCVSRRIGLPTSLSVNELAVAGAEGHMWGGGTCRQGMGTSSLTRSGAPETMAPGDYHGKSGTEAPARGTHGESPGKRDPELTEAGALSRLAMVVANLKVLGVEQSGSVRSIAQIK
jgi:hypothetical protein